MCEWHQEPKVMSTVVVNVACTHWRAFPYKVHWALSADTLVAQVDALVAQVALTVVQAATLHVSW